MSFDYTSLATVADELLTEFGQAVTIGRNTAGAYDTSTGSATVTTESEDGTAAVFDYSPSQRFRAGGLILDGDKHLLLSSVGISEPRPGDIVTIGSVDWAIITVKTTAPAGTAVLYECQVRR